MNTRIRVADEIDNCLIDTNLPFGEKYTGKVRDMYFYNNLAILISTDRQSAFDRLLGAIPFKGQVLTMCSWWWFGKTKHIVKNHAIANPDQNTIIAKKCKVLPIEFVVRGYISGSTSTSLWTNYEKGVRNYCGIELPDNLVKNQKLEKNIVTPTTKEKEHDRPITPEQIIAEGWLTKEQWDYASKKSIELFEFGQKESLKHGLILVDTKYEFGLDLETNEIILIDEIHTPDSSRFWIKDTYATRFNQGLEPDNIDKEFFRLWFVENSDPYNDKTLPEAPNTLIADLSSKYIQQFEYITGEKFDYPKSNTNIQKRILENINNYFNL